MSICLISIKFLLLSSALVILFLEAGYTIKGESVEVNANIINYTTDIFRTYTDTDFGITISYPTNWLLSKPSLEFILTTLRNMENDPNFPRVELPIFDVETAREQLTPIVAFTAPPDNYSDESVESVLIMEFQLPQAYAPEQFDYEGVRGVIFDWLDDFPKSNLLESPHLFKIEGNPAVKYVYTYKILGQEDKIMQILMMKEDKMYRITFGEGPETYSLYLPTIEKIIKSFKVN